MKKRISLLPTLILCSLILITSPAITTASDEFQEAARQTEDQWQAVRGSLKEGKETLDDLQKKYKEYRDAAFSDSPEKGLELARILFKLDKNDTKAAEQKVALMRKMFRDMDAAGISTKLEAASQYLDKANSYAGEVSSIWEFTKKFDPENAKDNPTYGLRLIGSLLTESAEKMEAIPLVGQVLGAWVKAYGEVAGDFSNALDRLAKKIDNFRGGSLCGQLGLRQDQQKTFKAAGGTGCLTYFASGIFPRLQGETYEGDADYFLYDAANKRGFMVSKEAEVVYRWHERLIDPRVLYPDWLASRANSIRPEMKNQAREAYALFSGWKNQTDLSWLIIQNLGLYQDAYTYGRLDEEAFMGNYILDRKHHKAINAILMEYEKYILVQGMVYEGDDDGLLLSRGAMVEFTVGGNTYSAITENNGKYEVLIKGNPGDSIHEKVSKEGFETIEQDGRISHKVVTGLNYNLTNGTAFGEENLDFQIGELAISLGNDHQNVGSKYALGDDIHLQVNFTGVRTGSGAPITGAWNITLPDGRQANPQQVRLLSEPGVSGSLSYDITTDERLPQGTYGLELVISFEGREVAWRRGSFDLLPLFENEEILITDSEENLFFLNDFRPADPLLILAKMVFNSPDPTRQVHLSVELEGPDPVIYDLGVEADQNFDLGSIVTGVGRDIPNVIQEGTYAATVTLDGGDGQRITLQSAFRVVHPVKFDGIWPRDGLVPSQVQSRFSGGDPYEWFMRYHFVDARPGDQYSSALWCYAGDIQISMLSSDPLGPNAPYNGPASSSFTGIIPMDMPSSTYGINGVVWYNGVAYYSSGASFKVGQEPIITITSPQHGFVVDKKVLVINGTCADRELQQARMYTNGEVIPIKLSDGKFSAKTVLRPGQNEIRVVAENELAVREASVWGTANIQPSVLKVVLTWDAPGTDVDLWVTDPQGAVTNYKHKKPAEGRQLDVDDTSGPGMETYTVEVPLRGQYSIAVHYFGAGGWGGAVPFNLQITTWETTFSETRSSAGGTLYKAAGSRDEPGAVEYFTVPVY